MYTAFSDESYITAARYRGMCSVSLPTASLEEVERDLRGILAESKVEEFKWQKTKNAKYRLCAEKLYAYTLEKISDLDLRVDVLIWDTHDSRHRVARRDDNANYERMFFHLLKNVMKKRERNASWNLFPDERLGVDWDTIESCLREFGKHEIATSHPLLNELLLDTFYNVATFKQVDSKHSPCSQLADLFAGIAVYSKEKYDLYADWADDDMGTMTLFPKESKKYSNGEHERFGLIRDFNQACKDLKMRVSLKEKRAFWTPDPSRPLNFWHYEPQHELDKAPQK